MPGEPPSLLDQPAVGAALRLAWLESNPGIVGGHEEGGFIVRDAGGNLSVVRWPRGASDNIDLPPHTGCRVADGEIVATFHTHPNTGPDYLQEPSETDRRAVRDDPDLKGAFYEGEFVISNDRVYRITPDGRVSTVAETARLFEDPGGRES